MKAVQLILIGALSAASFAALADERAEFPAQQEMSTLTRAQVKADLAAAIKAGEVHFGQLDAAPKATAKSAHDEMKADRNAARVSWLRVGELG